MEIGFFRKLKDFGKRIFKGMENVVKKVLPVVVAALRFVLPKPIRGLDKILNTALNIVYNITEVSLGEKPPDEHMEYCDCDNEYMKLKNGI